MGNFDIRFYRSIFLRRLPFFLAILLSVSGLGFFVASILPPTYRADAKIIVESPQISAGLARPTVPVEIVKQMQLVQLQMMTRPNLLALADRFGLYKDRSEASENDIVDDMRSRMSVDPIRLDAPRGSEAATAFVVSFKAKDPVLAADVVNEFVKLIIQKNADIRSGQASETLRFFQQETERLASRLSQLESEISDFKNRNKDALPESLSFRRTQQLNLQERLMQLSREESSLRDGRSRLMRVLAGTDTSPNAAAMTPAEQTLAQLRRVLTEQRTVLADQSPGIVNLKTQIAALEKAVQAERSDKAGAGDGKSGLSDLDMQLADIDQRLQLIAREKDAIDEKLANLAQTIAATPGNEATLNALERQYQNVQSQYNVASGRLADASTGERIEMRSKGERLSILELASPPQRPIGPKRFAIAAGSAVAGLVLAFGFVVLMEFLNKSIRRPIELIEALQIEPLATIPYIPAAGETRSTKLALIPTALRRNIGM
ncbi:GumC family protein [Microvirga thermotolerans]|uniref:Lipopolysaccharide biosynthesis protein n=1 Tax=Microvirga thermotolerans TaxID=2651334 RepID=A0A5P9JZ36_9HYPH|nr:lipopolysaccharide biosynthesis protein [Microvirga thermotolerans]QFU17867.1 lipopolysaccharide biosynthesis protein [Microvirga thermotolerans]